MSKRIFYKRDIDTDNITNLIKDVLGQNDAVIFAYIYGSFIEKEDFFCDIDIAIYAKADINPHLLSADIKGQISSALTKGGVDGFIADDFDVRVMNDAPYDFVMRILEKGLLILSKDEELRRSYIEHISMEYRINQIVLSEALR